MEHKVKINDRTANVKLIERNDNFIKVSVDEQIYEIDTIDICDHTTSLLHAGKSHCIEVVTGNMQNKYSVNTLYNSYDIEIIDPRATLLNNSAHHGDDDNHMNAMMPGKIIKILVAEGDEVVAGQTILILEAMKMQSEYKVSKNKKVKSILISEGDLVNGGQNLIVFE